MGAAVFGVMSRFLTIFLAYAALGCGGKPVPKTSAPPAPQASSRPAVQAPAVAPASPQLGVSADLAAQCQVQLSQQQAPNFDYNDFALLPEDRAVLEKVASCVMTGPLKGRTLRLVGRADPRGTREYNLGLGDRRAHTVSSYLARLGVASGQLATATRGDLDATGHDERAWREDRRVDITLAR